MTNRIASAIGLKPKDEYTRLGSMICRIALFLSLLAGAAPCAAATIAPGGGARLTAERQEGLSRVAVPVGAWSGGVLPTEEATGAITRQAWKIPGDLRTPLEILAPLRQGLADDGYDIVFECADFDCGGFDFRFATDLLPEPAMHVDLGDYQWLTARRPDSEEVVTIMASRSSSAGFVQVTQVGPAQEGAQAVTLSSRNATDPLLNTLIQQGRATLEDLEFSTGAARLEDGEVKSLSVLGRWLADNPDQHLRLEGHTDSQGALNSNIALSEARAAAVRERLIAQFNVDPSQISVQGLGPSAPRASNDTADGRRLNRRVEAVLD